MTIHEAAIKLKFVLYEVYDNSESASVADLVMEHLTGWSRINRVVNRDVNLSRQAESLLARYMNELSAQRPVQYVIGESWFCNLKFFVSESVLIPRPETEELVEWASRTIHQQATEKMHALDIGTGSGCIAIALQKKQPSLQMFACDVSDDALAIARKNATDNHVDVTFVRLDVLQPKQLDTIPNMDFIVSNPPYIPQSELSTLAVQVTNYEPHLALFVPDADPLIFYRSIADLTKKKLNKGGSVFTEVHFLLAEKVAELFRSTGFLSVEVRNDIYGKPRMVKASR